MSKEYTSSNPYIKAKIDTLINDEGMRIKAFATVIIGGTYVVHGLRIFNSETKGLFVAMPSTPYIDRNGLTAYKEEFHPITKQGYKMLQETVLEAYHKKLVGKEEPASEYEFKEVDLLDLPFD